MKSSAIIRIVIYALLILILSCILLAGLSAGRYGVNFGSLSIGNASFHGPLSDGNRSSSGSVSANSVQKLRINWVSGSVRIQPGDTDQITFSETPAPAEEDRMLWKQEGDQLTIQIYANTGFSFGILHRPSKDLVITVPRTWDCRMLELDTVSADVTVQELSGQEIRLNSVSGDSSFESCSMQQLGTNTTSGNIRYSGVLDQLSCDTVSADCEVSLSVCPSRAEMNSVSGDLILAIPADSGFSAKLDTMSGDINVSGFSVSVDDKTHLCGDGRCQIDADTVSGDINIRRR